MYYHLRDFIKIHSVQLAEVKEYTDCISVDG